MKKKQVLNSYALEGTGNPVVIV